MVSNHGNEEQCQFIPDYTHKFASGPAVETEFKLIIPWIIPLITFWTVSMVSRHGNQGQCKIIPNYSHDFASGPAVETELSWLFLWLFLIIPNYSYYAHNPRRSNGNSLGNQLPQKRAIACRGPENHCPLRFGIMALVSKFGAGDGKKAWCFVSMLVRPAIRND